MNLSEENYNKKYEELIKLNIDVRNGIYEEIEVLFPFLYELVSNQISTRIDIFNNTKIR